MQQKAKTRSKKKPGRRLLKLIIIGLFIISGWYIWNYTKPDNYPIRHVKVFATYEHISRNTIKEIIAPYLSNGFFYLNVIKLKQQLLALPWVYEINLQRQWPDVLTVNIVEQKAVLQWGGRALINNKGEIFIPPAHSFPHGLPVIFGPKEKEGEILGLYKRAILLFKPLNLTIKQMVLNAHHYWEIILSDDTVVYLKENSPLSQLELLTNIYKKITVGHDKSPRSIDLRYQSGFAVKWE